MVKARMTTADVAAEISCLRKLIGMRVANVYDLNPKTYVIKLARSGGVTGTGESEKELLLLESGVRLHTTQFARDKSNTPSGITLKIRKHIRTRRLEDIRQLGVDRVIDFQFGLGEQAHHLILELYASGNILLTDADYNVLTLLRSHRDDEKGISMMAKHRYPIETCRSFRRTSAEQVASALTGATETELESAEGGENKGGKGEEELAEGRKGKGEKREGGPTLKDVLGQVLGYGPTLCEHCILDAGLEPGLLVKRSGGALSDEQLEKLVAAIGRFEDWLELTREKPTEGFIVFQKPKAPGVAAPAKEKKGKKGKKGGAVPTPVETAPVSKTEKEAPSPTPDTAVTFEGAPADSVKSEGLVKPFDEFTPLILKQHAGREWGRFETFDAAMDEFFSKVEGQKLEQQQKQQEVAALSRLDKIKADQTSRVEALQATVQQSVRKAELIEYNLEDVDAAINAVRSALANGMDWADLKQMVKEERKAGNPVAGLIHSMQLERNQISLLLSNNLDDMVEEEKTRPVDKVEVDISLSAFANARMHFDTKKKHAIKQQKTVDATERALKAAEKKTAEQLAQVRSMARLTSLRKVHWFERFSWFVSSENYLVLAGRDAQQNEQLVKKHLGKGDVYVHADLHGAATCIVKNADPEAPIPPLTLIQAGTMSVCRSSAWDAKIVTSAWWVHSHQVSKTAPTGEYLTVGSFMVRGKKNFLPPSPLVMGFGFLFRLEESSLAAHLGERRIRGEGEADDGAEQERAPRGRRVLNEGELPTREVGGNSDGEDDDVMFDGSEGSADEEREELGKGEIVKDAEEVEATAGGKGVGTRAVTVETAEKEAGGEELGRGGKGSEEKSQKGRIEGDDVTGEKEELGAREKDGEEIAAEGGVESSALDDLLDTALAMGGRSRGATNASTTSEVQKEASERVPRTGKRYVSKAQRKKMKKGHVGDDNVDETEREVGRPEGTEGKPGPQDLESDGQDGAKDGAASGEGAAPSQRTDGQDESGRKNRDKGGAQEAAAGAPVKEEVSRGKEEATRGNEGLTRGKRAKLKKAKGKYADQDEEERELRMALLASAGKSEKASGKGGKKGGKEAPGKGGGATKSESGSGAVDNDRKVCYKCKQPGHVAKDCPLDAAGKSAIGSADSAAESGLTEAGEESGGAQNSSRLTEEVNEKEVPADGNPSEMIPADGTSAEGANETKATDASGMSRRARARAQNEGERAEIAAILEEENLQELPDEERDRLTDLDALTGIPRSDDILLYAVPMCGPYTALQGFKYKVKLTPGTVKKGKAAKTAVEVFSRIAEANAREKELMKAVQDPDLVAVMSGNVKVTAPGLTKMKQTQKKGRKASAQKH